MLDHEAFSSLSYVVMRVSKRVEVCIEGHVAPGFESVRSMFESNLRRGCETKAQLCVYVAGQRVIDIFGQRCDELDANEPQSFTGHSLLPIFSSTKSVTALCMACMVDEGHINYNTRIVEVWPEFGRHGKGEITLSDLLRHEAGLVTLCRTLNLDEMHVEKVKANVVGAVIEESLPHFPPRLANTKREYHSVTRGLILNEIFRRIHPLRRTMGEFVQLEISERLGLELSIGGLSVSQLELVSPITCWSIPSVMFQSLVPVALGRRIEPHFSDFSKVMRGFLSNRTLRLKDREWRRRSREAKRIDVIHGMGNMRQPQAFLAFFQSKQDNMSTSMSKAFRTGEMPSMNGFSNARSLARLGALIVNKGCDVLSGHRIISEAGLKEMHGQFTIARDFGLPHVNTCFSQGGVNQYRVVPGDSAPSRRSKSLRSGFVGWLGMNGSVFQWNPDLKISFAYTPALVHWYDSGNVLAGKLQAEVVNCVSRIQNGLEK